MKNNKKKLIICTIYSAILFSILLVVTSLSPMADIGENSNKFGTAGMWLGLAFLLICYLVPLLLYSFGISFMKYIMAVACVLGAISIFFLIIAFVIIGAIYSIGIQLFIAIGISILLLIVNSRWMYLAFISKPITQSDYA
ncbi:DUF5391 family protein [Psychrobacillus sp. MER TA 171]|uniref:DUF5391 family protein n=1 Tax=Psychrobacillus sp. MER TA 171 TaxID=2939577 RepID=UPI00203FF95C|nr:DUF5391 domain-containing protein [Psychrobacillus sp. MER TA 171]